MTLKTNLNSSKIIRKLLTIVLTFSLCLSVFSFNQIKENKVHAEVNLDIPGFIKTVKPSIVVSGLVMYMTKLGITFVGNMDKVIEYLTTKLQEYGLWTRLIANGIKINLSNKRILLDNTTLGLFNEFVDEYQTENENNNINVDENTSLDFSGHIYGTNLPVNDMIFPYLTYNNKYTTSYVYSILGGTSNLKIATYYINDEHYLDINNMYNKLPTYNFSTSSSQKIIEYDNNSYYVMVNANIGIKIYTDLQNVTLLNSGSFTGRVTPFKLIFLYNQNNNDLMLCYLHQKKDANNNNYYEITPMTAYYTDNYSFPAHEWTYNYKYAVISTNYLYHQTNITYTDIYNALANYNDKLSEITDNQESYVMTMNNLQASYEDNNEFMQAILSEIADGKVAVTTQVSNETGMTEQEAQQSNWFTIITTSLSSWFDNLFDNDVSTSVDSTIENYNEIENDLTNELDTNINNITIPSINDFGVKFMTSSNFIKDNFDSMTISNPFGSVITFVLVIGIALLIIGRGLL